MSADAFIDRLWDTRPPAKARENLSVYVTRLRASLRRPLGDAVPLAGRAGGYVLQVDPETVDLHQFRGLRRQASALAAEDTEKSVLLLRKADGLWRGPALAGIRGDWIARMRHSLEEERRAAIVERVKGELELGRHAELVGELGGLLARYPLDETLVACQMTALYRGGRTSDALSLFRETRNHLVEEQGAEPSPALAELHQQVLRHDPGLAPRPRPAPADGSESDALPLQTEEFTGRDDELAAVTHEHADGRRVFVIEGPAGIGKTQLAIRAARTVADQYPDGTLYLDLRNHDPIGPPVDAGEALHSLLWMLGVPTTQIPDSLTNRAALWQAHLSRRLAIVVLDDAASYDQIGLLLSDVGRSLFLITTRRRFPGLQNARVLTLDLLSRDDAVALFSRIAEATSDRARHDREDAAAAVELCGRLPLTIQLTAARMARDGAFRLAKEPKPIVQRDIVNQANPEVATAFDLSYAALEPQHRSFLLRIGLSPSSQVSAEAAAALAGSTLIEAQKALAVLVDSRLLTPNSAGQYQFHDLIKVLVAVLALKTNLRLSGARQ